MGKHNTVSGVLVLVVVLMIAITTFMVVNYGTSILGATVAFISTSQGKLAACGITAPPELLKLQADVPNLLVPAIYVGFPCLMIIIAILMFIAGYYFGGGKEEHSSETTTTTSSPNRNHGKYASGRHVEETRTEKSSKSEET